MSVKKKVEPSLNFCESADISFDLKSSLYLFSNFYTQAKVIIFSCHLTNTVFYFPSFLPYVWPPLTSHLSASLPVPLLHFFSLSLFPIPLFFQPPLLLYSPHLENYEWKFIISLWNHIPPFCFSFYLLYSFFSLLSFVFTLHPSSLCLDSPLLLKEQHSSPYSSHVSLSPLFILLSHVLHPLDQCGRFSVPQSGWVFWRGDLSFQDLLLMDIYGKSQMHGLSARWTS